MVTMTLGSENMKIIVTILAAVLACGCYVPKQQATSTLWDKSEIIGYRLELLAADDQFESITLFPSGTATVVLGNENAIAGPLMFWHYDSSGTLVVKGEKPHVTLQNVKVKGNTVEVLRNGKAATYKRTKVN
jgi:hypothetical protein